MSNFYPLRVQFYLTTSLSDRQDYIEYALFYGLYFNREHVKLSYIRHMGEQNEEQLFYPLQILNLKEESYSTTVETVDEPEFPKISGTFTLREYQPPRYSKLEFFLCPYRYFLDYISTGGIVHKDQFQIQQYFISFLSNQVRYKHSGKKMSLDDIRRAVSTELDYLQGYFPFLRGVNDIPDMRDNAIRYIQHNLLDQQGKIATKHSNHEEIRDRFIKAAFYEPVEPDNRHPYESMEELVAKESGSNQDPLEIKRKYSLVKIFNMDVNNPSLGQRDMMDYLHKNMQLAQHSGPWCNYCQSKTICKRLFMKTP